MRKPKKLEQEQLQPFQWTPPGDVSFRLWGTGRPASSADAAPTLIQHQPIDWPSLFANNHPVEIEIGFGKGLFLVNQGKSRQGTNFFGIEIIRKYFLYVSNRIARHNLLNVKVCCADAKGIFQSLIAPGSVSAVHVYFPDPWWKERHKKRLLMTAEFCQRISIALAPSGRLHFATDVPDYFAWVQETLATLPSFALLERPAETEPQHQMDYLTNFERRFRLLGKPIHRAIYQKIESQAE